MTKLFERGFPCFNLSTANAVTVTATNNNSTPITAILATTKVIRVAADGHACHFTMDGTATGDSFFIPAGHQEYFATTDIGVTPAFINASSGNNSKVNLTEFDS